MKNTNHNQDVLMILPKKTIRRVPALHENWELENDPSGTTLYINHIPAGYVSWTSAEDFGMPRPAIRFNSRNAEERRSIFELLISHLALNFEKMPSRNPLYIRLHADQVDLIAQASRLGFIPYFGEWSESSADQSEESWRMITESLRAAYPSSRSHSCYAAY